MSTDFGVDFWLRSHPDSVDTFSSLSGREQKEFQKREKQKPKALLETRLCEVYF